MKFSRCLFLLVILTSLGVSAQFTSPLHRIQPTELIIHSTDGSRVEMKTVVVTQTEDRQRGLMYIKHLPTNMSMLFVNQEERLTGMWMKNTYVALDMWFVSPRGEVVDIVKHTKPLSEESISSKVPALVVIEVNAGLSDRLGITLGATVKHAALGNVD